MLERHREEHLWPVAAIRLLTLTGARLSEIVNLRWDEIGEVGEDGASARIEDSKTGPRTIWLGPEAARLLAALPRAEGRDRVFPDDLTPGRLYAFWVGVREEAGLPGLRLHDCRHTWASQGVMNGVGLTTVGRLLGHRKRETAAIYAHLDDGALRDAAAQAAAVIARAMGCRAGPPPLPADTGGKAEANKTAAGAKRECSNDAETRAAASEPREPSECAIAQTRPGTPGPARPHGGAGPRAQDRDDWL